MMFRRKAKNELRSARNLLRDVPVEAVRFGYDSGHDVLALWRDEGVHEFGRWAVIRRALIVGGAMTILKDGLAKINPQPRRGK